MNQRKGLSFVLYVIFIAVGIFAACKRTEQKGSSILGKVSEPVLFAGTLVSRIPSNSFFFVKWDGGSQAYAKFAASPWGAGSSGLLPEKNDSPLGKFYAGLAAIGLDPADKEMISKCFSEAVAFGVFQADRDKPALGLIFKSQDLDLSAKLSAIKTELLKAGQSAEDLKIDPAVGLNFSLKDSSQGDVGSFFLLVQSDFNLLTTDKALAEEVIHASGTAIPSFVDTASFKQAVSQFPAADSRFVIGAIDLQQLSSSSQQLVPAAVKQEQSALKVAAFSLAMEETPQAVARLVYDPAAAGADSIFNTLNVSPGEELFKSLPEKPLLVINLDGQIIKRIKERVVAAGNAGQTVSPAPELAFLDKLNRVALVAGVAPLGQTMLPIPDLMLVLNAKDPSAARDGIESLISNSLGKNAMSKGLKWSERDIDGKNKMKAVLSPLGVGAFLAVKGNTIILSSTEASMKDAFTGKWNDSTFKRLSSRSRALTTDSPTAVIWYLDFKELAKVLENAKGMLSMYAPAQEEAASFLNQASLDALSKKGMSVGMITARAGEVHFQAAYQAPPAE